MTGLKQKQSDAGGFQKSLRSLAKTKMPEK